MTDPKDKPQEYQNFEQLAQRIFRAKKPKPQLQPQDKQKPPQGKKEES